MTSKTYADPDAVELTGTSFVRGGLNLTSYARPGKLFTANDSLVVTVTNVAPTISVVTMMRSVRVPMRASRSLGSMALRNGLPEARMRLFAMFLASPVGGAALACLASQGNDCCKIDLGCCSLEMAEDKKRK